MKVDQAPDRPSTPIRVRRGVIGILRKGSDLLLIRRAEGIAKGGCWCFPGRHVERGETSRRAVQRELAEELGIAVEPIERRGSVRVLDSNHILAVWTVRHVGGRFRLGHREIAEMRWLSPADIRSIKPNLPSNEEVLAMLSV